MTELTRSDTPRASATPPISTPKAFLSYAFDDKDLARTIAKALMAKGIDTWWAEWSIGAGDSLRQKIDEGLGQCTHFIVLLTPRSIDRPWVNAEIDAGFMRRFSDGIRFIPLRCGVPPEQLPPTLATLLSPEIACDQSDVTQLINDIYKISRKPQLGSPPAAVSASASAIAAEAGETPYSPAATALARYFVEHSEAAQDWDPEVAPDVLMAALELTQEDLADAAHELGGLVGEHLDGMLFPKELLFSVFDSHWKPWDPAQDALFVATQMVNDSSFPDKPAEMAPRLGWEARRLNPALAYLLALELVEAIRCWDGTNFLAHRIDHTEATRRFVKTKS